MADDNTDKPETVGPGSDVETKELGRETHEETDAGGDPYQEAAGQKAGTRSRQDESDKESIRNLLSEDDQQLLKKIDQGRAFLQEKLISIMPARFFYQRRMLKLYKEGGEIALRIISAGERCGQYYDPESYPGIDHNNRNDVYSKFNDWEVNVFVILPKLAIVNLLSFVLLCVFSWLLYQFLVIFSVNISNLFLGAATGPLAVILQNQDVRTALPSSMLMAIMGAILYVGFSFAYTKKIRSLSSYMAFERKLDGTDKKAKHPLDSSIDNYDEVEEFQDFKPNYTILSLTVILSPLVAIIVAVIFDRIVFPIDAQNIIAAGNQAASGNNSGSFFDRLSNDLSGFFGLGAQTPPPTPNGQELWNNLVNIIRDANSVHQESLLGRLLGSQQLLSLIGGFSLELVLTILLLIKNKLIRVFKVLF